MVFWYIYKHFLQKKLRPVRCEFSLCPFRVNDSDFTLLCLSSLKEEHLPLCVVRKFTLYHHYLQWLAARRTYNPSDDSVFIADDARAIVNSAAIITTERGLRRGPITLVQIHLCNASYMLNRPLLIRYRDQLSPQCFTLTFRKQSLHLFFYIYLDIIRANK